MNALSTKSVVFIATQLLVYILIVWSGYTVLRSRDYHNVYVEGHYETVVSRYSEKDGERYWVEGQYENKLNPNHVLFWWALAIGLGLHFIPSVLLMKALGFEAISNGLWRGVVYINLGFVICAWLLGVFHKWIDF